MYRPKGRQGTETHCTEFSKEEIEFVEVLSEKYTLNKNIGLDYYGNNKPEIELGYGWRNWQDTGAG